MNEYVDLIILNKENANGRIYTEKSFSDLPNCVYVYLSDNFPIGIASEFRFKDNVLQSKVTLVDKKIISLINNNIDFAFSTNGTGEVVNGIVLNYSIESIVIGAKGVN